jgi:hypothetical protein
MFLKTQKIWDLTKIVQVHILEHTEHMVLLNKIVGGHVLEYADNSNC